MARPPRVAISRCLLGDEVRHDGGHKREAPLVEAFEGAVEWVPVCPEVEVGMGVPREPIQLAWHNDGVRLLGVTTGRDWTERMQSWARQRIAELDAQRIAGFVLKARSPSCGVRDVPRRGTGPPGTGLGMFAEALVGRLPDLPVSDEEQLRDAGARAAFLDRAREYDRRRFR